RGSGASWNGSFPVGRGIIAGRLSVGGAAPGGSGESVPAGNMPVWAVPFGRICVVLGSRVGGECAGCGPLVFPDFARGGSGGGAIGGGAGAGCDAFGAGAGGGADV